MEGWTVKSVDGVEAQSAQEKEQAVVEQAAAESPNVEIAGSNDDVIKVNLDEPIKTETEDAIQERETEEIPVGEQTGDSPQVDEQVREQPNEEESVIELIQDEPEESPLKDDAQEEVVVTEEAPPTPQMTLPENIEKLVQFMDETGGSLEDYIELNRSYDEANPVDVIKEHYKRSKPHLDDSEIEFLMNEKFGYDEDADEPREIKKKQLAFKEELYDAKKTLEANKEKYYADLKLNKRDGVPSEYADAVNFYSEYKQSQEENEKAAEHFKNGTKKLFNDEFKGFDFKVGDNKYRYKVNDVAKTMDYQSDLNNFIGEFVGDSGNIEDVAGYHKALFAAKNADKIAQHFYEQGRADALKRNAKESKNIDMSPKGDAASVVRTKSGTQFRVVSGDSSNGLKFKMTKR